MASDFNITKCFWESIGPKIHLQAMDDFNDVNRGLRLIEPTLFGQSYNWIISCDNPSFAKLGYFLYSFQ